MAQRQGGMDMIAGASTVALPDNVPSILEIDQDPSYRTLGNAHSLGDVAHARIWIACNADEHMGVVCEERPLVWVPAALRSGR
jgi:hypothetical protein